MSEKPVAILVLGMHRSGTSALTRVLNLCGVDLGTRLMPPAEGNNELGFWEHVDAVEIHERLLTQLGRSWSDPRGLPPGWLESPAAATAVERIKTLVHTEFAGSRLWAVKDPRTCRFVPLWTRALGELGIEVRLLFALRHPDEVGASLARRDGLSLAESGLLQLNHFFEAALASVGCARCAVTYASLLDDWRGCMRRIGTELGLELPALDAAAAEVERFLDLGARNHHSEDDDSALRESLNGRVYLLARDSTDAARFWSGVAALGDVWDLYRRDLLPFVEELLGMLAARDALQRHGRGAGTAPKPDQREGNALSPLGRLQFRMISGLQEGMGKLGQASADLGAMVRIGNEAALAASGEVAAAIAALREAQAGLPRQAQDTAGLVGALSASAAAQQHQLGQVLTEIDVLRRHMDHISAADRAHGEAQLQQLEQQLQQCNALAQQAWQLGEQAQQREQMREQQLQQQLQPLAQGLEALARGLETLTQGQAALAARLQQQDEARWSRRLRSLLSGK